MRIFYSWQSDTDGRLNLHLIQDALEWAAKAIRSDRSVNVEPSIDRDTKGELGAVPIRETILTKIDSSDVFVADVTSTNRNEKGELAPNPNILFELGYAYKSLTFNRLVLVQNTAFGEELPFDLKGLRLLQYAATEENRTEARKKLGEELRGVFEMFAKSLAPKPEPIMCWLEHTEFYEAIGENWIFKGRWCRESLRGAPREKTLSISFWVRLHVSESLLASYFWRTASHEEKLRQFWQFTADRLRDANTAPELGTTVEIALNEYFEDQVSKPGRIYDDDDDNPIRMDQPFRIAIDH